MAVPFNNKLCIEARELIRYNSKRNIGSEKGFMSEASYNKKCKEGKIKVERRGVPGSSALVDFDSMHLEIREKYIEIYGDPRDTIHIPGALESVLLPDEKARTFFIDWRYGEMEDEKLKPEVINEYTLHARILNAIIFLRDNKRRNHVGGGSTKINIWEHLSELCNDLARIKDNKGRLLYPHKLPTTPATLKRKVQQYEKEGYKTLVHKNYGNVSATKIKGKTQMAFIHQLIAQHNNLNNETIRQRYNLEAQKRGWDEINSITTVENWHKKFGPETEAGRRGLNEFYDKIAKQIKRSAPVKPLTYWTIDGWTAELLYRKRTKDSKGYNTTTYHNRLTIVFVLDPCCKYPIGYAIGTKETSDLIQKAVKNAVNHTRELFGERFKPYQIQSDNFGRGVLKPFYEACTHHYTPARAHNAKAKVVEPYNNYINKTYCQLFDNWSGFNITSPKDNQPNMDYMQMIKKDFPDEAGCYAQLEQIIAWERKKKVGAYLSAWNNVTEDDKLRFSDEEYLMLFGQSNGWTHTIDGAGLTISINGQKYLYESFDTSLTYHFHERFLVRYDPDNMEKVLITNAKGDTSNKLKEEIGSVRYILEERHIVPMALRDQVDDDFEYRSRVKSYNDELVSHVTSKMGEAHDIVTELLEEKPCLPSDNILERLCLTDSRGQHKNNRNSLREGTEDRKVIKTLTPPKEKVPITERGDDTIAFNSIAFLRSVRQQ